MPASRLQVLVSEPDSGNTVYAPYVWALLKSWFERNGTLQDRVSWLDPIFSNERLEQALDKALQQRIDVLGLSCCAWKFTLQTQIAQKVKRKHPACLVVMGGPEPDLKDPAFGATYRSVGIVVEHEGEVPFQRIFEAQLRGADVELQDIPGLYLRSPTSGKMEPTAPPQKLRRYSRTVASWSSSLVRQRPKSVAAIPDWLQRQRRLLMGIEPQAFPPGYLAAFGGKAALLEREASFEPWRRAYFLHRSPRT